MIKNFRVDGRDFYQIDFRDQPDGTIKLFDLNHPPDPHGKTSLEHHLCEDGWICVSPGSEPRTMDRAKAIAVHWMEGYSEYIRTGVFPKVGRRVTV